MIKGLLITLLPEKKLNSSTIQSHCLFICAVYKTLMNFKFSINNKQKLNHIKIP